MNNHVVILGASVSGHNIARRIREEDRDCRITLITDEDYPAYDHLKLVDFISGITHEDGIFLCSEEWYVNNNISFIKNKRAGAINTSKKQLYFKDKGSINYDILVISSGRSPVVPEIPGARKRGVFRLYTLDDAKSFLKHYIASTVCVVGSDVLALKMSQVICEKYKTEVKLLSESVFDPSLIHPDIEVINDAAAEILGEGEVQAIKLKSGKVFGVCAVLFMGEYKSNIDFLKGSDIKVDNDFVLVDGWMCTSNKDIFACGSVVKKDSIVISLMLAGNIINRLKDATERDASRVG